MDTAASGLPSSLAAALTMVAPEHLVYGSDSGVPCSMTASIETNKQALRQFDGLSPAQLAAVGRENVLALFPTVADRVGGVGGVDEGSLAPLRV